MKFIKYQSRFAAGVLLVKFLKNKSEQLYNFISESKEKVFCFAIPNGGVPVTEGFCSVLKLNYNILIVRKIKIPYNTEAGFGAVTTDGTILINQALLSQLNLSEKAINDSIELTKEDIKARLKLYNKEMSSERLNEQKIKNKIIFILDDGLASGFTMLAAIKMIKKYKPDKIFIAVPTAPLRTIRKLQAEVVKIYCPNIREVMWFAVADAYKNWYDVSESEVKELLKNSKYYIN
ncbi:MAG: phosphoribosyltransferase [Promethearchaeota archaeon]